MSLHNWIVFYLVYYSLCGKQSSNYLNHKVLHCVCYVVSVTAKDMTELINLLKSIVVVKFELVLYVTV